MSLIRSWFKRKQAIEIETKASSIEEIIKVSLQFLILDELSLEDSRNTKIVDSFYIEKLQNIVLDENNRSKLTSICIELEEFKINCKIKEITDNREVCFFWIMIFLLNIFFIPLFSSLYPLHFSCVIFF